MSNGVREFGRFLALDKVRRFFQIIKQHGGVTGSLSQLYRTDWGLKDGKLVGVDYFGNKYYENNRYFMGRNRWCDFNKKVWLDYDASQIPPEWHRWLHHIADEPPTTHPPTRERWMLPHAENSLDMDKKYMPYSTTRPTIEAWEPQQPR